MLIHDGPMLRAENLLDFQYRPPGWIVMEATADGVVISDPDVSLIRAVGMGWRMLFPIALNAILIWGLSVLAPPGPFLWTIETCVGLLMIFSFYCIWQRWRTPSVVRIGNGRLFLRRGKGSRVEEHDWDVREIVDIETSFGSSTFHSFYSIRIHLRDGSRMPFLHCMNGREGRWVLNYLKMLIANEQGALMVQEGLAPALVISLPPPPLQGMGALVSDLEEQVVRMAPPGRPGSQSESISNQNKV